MSDHLLAVVRHATGGGVTLCCRASVRGNHLKAEVAIYPTKAADLPPAWIAELETHAGAGSTRHLSRPVPPSTKSYPSIKPALTALPPANWYPHPTGPGPRWWDGTQWTEHKHIQ